MTTRSSVVAAIDPQVIDAVVFDMDGVMTDTASVHEQAWKRMFDAFLSDWSARTGVPQRPFDRADYLAYVDGKQRDDGVASLLRSRGIELPRGMRSDPPQLDTVCGLANRKNDDFQRVLSEEGAVAFPASVTLVCHLQRRGVRTAVVSASRNCQQVLDAARIGNLFEVRVDGVDAERLELAGKPAPDMFLEAARRLGARPERAVVVEDAVAGVQAGHDGHFALVIGVARTPSEEPTLREHGADVVVRDLAEVRVEGR
jgi:beta-phosphoglucomutase family hydrolase